MQAKNLVCLIVLALMPCFLLGQVRAKVQRLADKLGKNERLESAHIGVAGSYSLVYDKYLKLSKMATTSELVALVNHASPVVKGYVLMALVNRKYDNLNVLFTKELESNNTVETLSGCSGMTETTASVIYWQLRNQPHFEKTLWTKQSIEKALFEVEEIVINSDTINRSLLYYVLENFKPQEKHHARLRAIAIRDGGYPSLIALARLKKEEDIDFILSFGKVNFSAIAEFPHERFWQFLLANSKEFHNSAYQKAVCHYCNEEALSLLFNCLDTLERIPNESYDNSPLKIFYRNIHERNCPLYDSILLRMWEKNKIISELVFNRFKQKYKNDFPRIMLNGMLEKGFFLFPDDAYGQNNPKLLKEILTMTKNQSIQNWQDVVSFNIKELSGSELINFVEILAEKERLDFKSVFLENMQKAEYAFDLHNNLLYLLETGDKSFEETIVKILQEKRKIWDDGNWGENFRETIKKYKLPVKL